MAGLHFIAQEPICKGWSQDKKYRVTDAQGVHYLLRISPAEQYDRKKNEFERMRTIAALGIPMCKPIEFGVCDAGVYSVQSWIDGTDAEEAIPALTREAQYACGREAGRILRKIHSVPVPENLEEWAVRFNRKIDLKMEKYRACPFQFEDGQVFIDYINENRSLLNDRPQVYQHGDYHRGNMRIGRDGKLYILDFDRDDYGDPWEDMKAITWDAILCPTFASGRIDGYFSGSIPPEFWKLLALYISVGMLSAILWAVPFGFEQIELFQNQAKTVLNWYDGMRNPVPIWYQKHKRPLSSPKTAN